MAPVTTPTPHMRIVALLSKAAPLIGEDHPAYALMQEALRCVFPLLFFCCEVDFLTVDDIGRQ